jgi:predicted ferric reductase
MNITVLDLSAYLGLLAVGAATANMFLGVLMALRYSPVRQWPHRQFNYFRLHNWCGYVALVASIIHPLILLWNKKPRFTFANIAYPVHSPSQPFENTLGALALYALAVVVLTSYFRVQLGRPLWKAFHFVVYFAAAALLCHSVLTSPDLTNLVDWLDGGKVFIEVCVLVIVTLSILRWRYLRPRRSSPKAGFDVG